MTQYNCNTVGGVSLTFTHMGGFPRPTNENRHQPRGFPLSDAWIREALSASSTARENTLKYP
jgi:hypothetical protein